MFKYASKSTCYLIFVEEISNSVSRRLIFCYNKFWTYSILLNSFKAYSKLVVFFVLNDDGISEHFYRRYISNKLYSLIYSIFLCKIIIKGNGSSNDVLPTFLSSCFILFRSFLFYCPEVIYPLVLKLERYLNF